MSEKIKTAVMEIIKAHMDGEDKNTKAVLSDVMDSVRETLEQEPCDECRNKRTSFCGNCNEYDEFEPCDDAISREHLLSEIGKLKKSPWFNNGKNNKDFQHAKYLERKEAVAIIENICIKTEPLVTPKPTEHFIDGIHAMGYREGYKDAQKQKSGKWIETEYHRWRCSVCREKGMSEWDNIHNVRTNYCPNCGADMRGAE